MNGFGEVSSPKERDAYDSEKNQEIRIKGTEQLDDSSGFSKKELRDTPFSDSSDPFKEYFPDRVSIKQPSASDVVARDADGKIRDSESGKCYESIADWKQEQETLAERYESVAEYWKKKAEEENAALQKINDEGEITVSDLKHYSHFQEYSLKAKENKEKAEAIWGKLESAESNIDINDVPDELCDDNGRQYRTEEGALIPNNTYVLNETTYKTDDNGNIYSIDGKLQPNTSYELNGNIYTTDDKGRIISCEAKPVRSPENSRDNEAQRQAGGEDRRPNDQGGHIIGRDMNGDSGIGNLIAMDSKINQSDYKRMENDIKTALDEGKDVAIKTEITYSDDSERPDKITVTVTTDGKDTVYKFDNNLDGSLIDEVPESEKKIVQDRLDETGGVISSIKKEYDNDGNLVETTVYITYTGEDGSTYRTSVVIENQ